MPLIPLFAVNPSPSWTDVMYVNYIPGFCLGAGCAGWRGFFFQTPPPPPPTQVISSAQHCVIMTNRRRCRRLGPLGHAAYICSGPSRLQLQLPSFLMQSHTIFLKSVPPFPRSEFLGPRLIATICESSVTRVTCPLHSPTRKSSLLAHFTHSPNALLPIQQHLHQVIDW
jgi:hypothetical protein